jgi:hypothetical protein
MKIKKNERTKIEALESKRMLDREKKTVIENISPPDITERS